MKNRRLFIVLTVIILISDLLFVSINYYASERSLQNNLQRNAVNLKNAYDLTLSLVYENMLQMATYLANQPEVQQKFLEGKRALEYEGGDSGGPETQKARDALYDEVAEGWKALMLEYDVRQLHFHLGPGSLSFLRVHSPQTFGDRMDDLRHIIVDSYREQKQLHGFELGRVYSGLRGVSPVWAEDQGQKTLVGVIEVGTSFQTLLDKITRRTGVEILVLLRDDLVQGAMWQESINKRIFKLSPDSSCYVEAVSDARALDLLHDCDQFRKETDEFYVHRLSDADEEYALVHFPLYDYQATTRGNDRQSGMIVMFTRITEMIAEHHHQLWVNLIYAAVGFAIIEWLLYLSLRLVSNRLRQVIDDQTAKIHELKEYYKSLSQIDGLSGLYNHTHFNQRLQQEMLRESRSRQPLCLLMCDIDDFKQVNDQFGHLVGDKVIMGIAKLIRQTLRASDFAGRYGGEEFIIALPETHLGDAAVTAQRFLEAVRAMQNQGGGEMVQVTASIGVVEWNGVASLEAFIKAADTALYRAKQQGKNCLVSGDEALVLEYQEG
ncbi:MAG: diguanylate cyclase [Candidatus Thiodiazotropha sp.]